METQPQTQRNPNFNIGKVLLNTFRIYLRKFIPVNLSAIAVWLPLTVAMVALDYLRGNLTHILDNSRWMLFYWSMQQVVWAALVLVPILYPISAAIIFHSVFQALSDDKVRFLASVSRGLARGFYVILLSVIIGFILILAMMVVLVPVIQTRFSIEPNMLWALAAILPTYLALMWSVALPACVVEDLGPIASMGRSRRLTQGQRWRVLGAGIIFGAMVGLVYFPLAIFARNGSPVWVGVIFFVTTAMLSAFAFVAAGAVYHELRRIKEGGDIKSMSAVFD